MKPLPWSHTALSDFKNCPKSYYHKRVLKDVKEEQGEAAIWGERVHKAFEERIGLLRTLPKELEAHEPFLKYLYTLPGHHAVEQKIGFDKQGKPCNWEYRDHIWFRGIIDFLKVHKRKGLIVDYKTGKPHNEYHQLYLFAIHTFMMYPVDTIIVGFYWTQTMQMTQKVIRREEIPDLWKVFLPDLRQYAQAFKEDIWQPRPSGLCHGWCPVVKCEHWKPKKHRR